MADGGCNACVRELFEELIRTFPDNDWLAATEDAEHPSSWRKEDAVACVKDAYENVRQGR